MTDTRRIILWGLVGAAVTLVVLLTWHYLLAAGLVWFAWRHLTRTSRRPRPKSSWSNLGRTAALMFAAWNSRWLKPSAVRVHAVPADVGERQRFRDDDGSAF